MHGTARITAKGTPHASNATADVRFADGSIWRTSWRRLVYFYKPSKALMFLDSW